jgi:hypothetical protein
LIKTEFSKKNLVREREREKEKERTKSARKYLAYLPGAEDYNRLKRASFLQIFLKLFKTQT